MKTTKEQKIAYGKILMLVFAVVFGVFCVLIAWISIWIGIFLALTHFIFISLGPYGEWISGIIGLIGAFWSAKILLKKFSDWLDEYLRQDEEKWHP
jgi:hypothetical protein